MKTKLVQVAVALTAVLAAACGGPPEIEEARSGLMRELNPQVTPEEAKALVTGNTDFAFDLYRLTRGDGNAVASPHSISIALAMTWAGARGETEAQMARALRFHLPQDRLHPAFDALDLKLASRGRGAQAKDGSPFRLDVVNKAWAQKGYPFEAPYLDTLALNYGAGVGLLDFQADAEGSRKTINDWVSYHTEELIPELLGPGSIDGLTRLVLTNAVYFNAAWDEEFDEADTRSEPFHRLDGSEVAVPMMSAVDGRRYASAAGCEAVELRYDGGELAMMVLLPHAGDLNALESSLNATTFDTVVQALEDRTVTLKMPRFKFEAKASFTQALTALGMPLAFSQEADFTGMSATGELVIGDVLHQAIIDVDESGTEAAAATAVVMEARAAPGGEHVSVTLDRPFLFLIRDLETGAVLFLGRVADPS